MPVVDASVLVEYLAGGEHGDQARARLLAAEEPLWAPHLVDPEIGHVLRRAVLSGELRPGRAAAALRDLAELPLNRAGHIGLLDRAWQLRQNLTFCDALYVALAERLDMPLVSLDARLATAPGVRAVVDVLA
jgi:predicted nucleic acid-binding protein